MTAILVIGYGNPLRGDDGAGWEAIRRLRVLYTGCTPDAPEFITCQQLTPEIAELASRASLLIFIDASCAGAPGTIKIKRVEPAEPSSDNPFTHHVSPAGVLELARLLYGRAPAAWIASIAAESMEIGERLTGQVKKRLDTLVARVSHLIDAHIFEDSA
ncbi:MAG: hydrogenase maturation protease [Candidatus Sumerlaeota bacterium]|nr:hydrogenase maturation protease [Candidatus Sumerlaeota bacterium]